MAEEKEINLKDPGRRNFFSKIASFFMAGGLIASYGYFASMAFRFLYPAKEREQSWLFVSELKKIKVGDSLTYTSPEGTTIAIARQNNTGGIEDFVALSSTCPHLGCQVHWEGPKNRFFCPCHNGAFNPQGKPTEGPPKDAGQSLSRYPLKIKDNLLFIKVPMEKLGGSQQQISMPNMPRR